MTRWKRISAALLLILLCVLLAPVAQAGQTSENTALPETGLQDQAERFGLADVEQAGEAYTGPVSLTEGLDIGEILRHLGQQGKEALGEVAKSALRSCVLLLTVCLLCSLAENLITAAGGDPLGSATLAASLAITGIAVGDVHRLLSLGEEAIHRMESLGDVLLPAVAMAVAAGGSPAAAAARHSITLLFSDVLIKLISGFFIPLCYAFVAASFGWAALGNDGLQRLGRLIKWLIGTLLSLFLLAFAAYLNLTGVISGGADAAAVKAAKFTISNLVPVVGGIIADTAETLLAGASVLRNAVGVFGMLAVAGICLLPFLHLGLHYLFYKLTAALAATVTGEGRVTGLIEALGSAFGLLLAMTGACGMLLIVALVSAVSMF